MMLSVISLLLPTRGRPDLAHRFLETAFNTCRYSSEVEIIMVVDEDDASYEGFKSPFKQTKLLAVGAMTMSGYNQFAAGHSSGDILVFVNDDIVVDSAAWDVAIRQLHGKYSDRVYLGFPNDGFKGARLSTFPILSRDTYQSFDTLPAIYSGAFIDAHLHEIFLNLRALGKDRICYLADVNFTHHHFRVTKMAPDDTYLRRDRFGDDLTFLRNVRTRHQVSLMMRDFLQTGILSKSSESNSALDCSIASFSYYLFACPAQLRYRLTTVVYMFLRLIYKRLFAWR